jgi:hypothetical protein
MFDQVRRSLGLALPRLKGEATIAVSDIVGTVGRGADFDRCFRPRERTLIDALGARRSVYSSTPGRAGAREASAKRDEALFKAWLGVVDDPRLTVGQLLERWLAGVAGVKLRPRSHERYARIVRSYLAPLIGRLRLNDLTEQHIATLYAELAKPRRVTGVLMTGAAMAQSSSSSSKSGQAAMSTPWFSGDASVHQWGTCVPSARRPPASSAAATLASA